MGFQVTIKNHTALPPFGSSSYTLQPPPHVSREWLRSVTQTEQVVTNPPLETAPPSKQRVAELTITKPLATGNARDAQILLCSILPREAGAKALIAVAKVCDSLYYSSMPNIGDCPRDAVFYADRDYSREVAAYECLSKAGQTGSFTPDYFGSWTFSLPITHNGQRRQRPVRLILIENLADTCMRYLFIQKGFDQIDAFQLSKEYRLQVLAILLDGLVRQYHAGVNQNDLAPRNIIIVPPPGKTQVIGAHPPRVVLIDETVLLSG